MGSFSKQALSNSASLRMFPGLPVFVVVWKAWEHLSRHLVDRGGHRLGGPTANTCAINLRDIYIFFTGQAECVNVWGLA